MEKKRHGLEFLATEDRGYEQGGSYIRGILGATRNYHVYPSNCEKHFFNEEAQNMT